MTHETTLIAMLAAVDRIMRRREPRSGTGVDGGLSLSA